MHTPAGPQQAPGPRASVCLIGAHGRMGQRCTRLLQDHPTLQLGAIWGRRGATPRPVAGAVCGDTLAPLAAHTDVVIDFSAPPACGATLPACADAKLPYLLASTGLSAEHEALVVAASARTALLRAANLSVGVNVLLALTKQAARGLPHCDVEIGEIHHRHKKDAPSGTARLLAAAVQGAGGRDQLVCGRRGFEPARPKDQLGVASLRGGEVAGEHTVYFFGDAERIELTHRCYDADIFAAGALQAAAWLLQRAPGLYTMQHMLGLV